MNWSPKLRRGLGWLPLGVLLLTACPSDPPVPDQAFVENNRAWIEGIDRVEPYFTRIEHLLPNRHYRREDGTKLEPLSTRVVMGEFVNAAPGVGIRGTGGTVAYNDKDADWRTLHLEFRVDENIAGRGPERVRVGWPSDGDVDKTRDGFISLGKTLLFLRPSPVYDYDKEVLAVLADGTFVATVGPDGELGLPFVSPPRSAVLLEHTSTISELRAEARKPPRTIQLREGDGGLEPLP